MNVANLRKFLWVYLLLLIPLAWFAAKFDLYAVDGDAVAYMDLADLIHAGKWHAAVNGYWHPLYPAFLAAGQAIFRTTRWSELGVYYTVNFFIFLLEVASTVLLVHGLVRLRKRLAPDLVSLFSGNALCLFALAMLLIAMMRELTLGKVRTDSLLQALLFAGIGLLLEALASEGGKAYVFSGLMGVAFGFAFLTKSFAFLLTVLSIGTLVAYAVLVCKRRIVPALTQGGLALICFAVVAGPYIAALSHQQRRFDFGDSGSLNYIWFVSGTEKFHLQPRMTDSFGSANVQLKHPEKELLQSPGAYSYTAMQYGTYPPWFNPTYWNDHITPKADLRLLIKRDMRNAVLIVRYLLNHAEAMLFLGVLLVSCATLRGTKRFALPVVILGSLVWAIYALVNVEERYVTAAFLLIVIGIFSMLKPTGQPYARTIATTSLLLFAALPIGATVREAAELRRAESVAGVVPAWRDPQIFGAAEGLRNMGLKAPDVIACIGMDACVHDNYWARIAGVRIVAEIYAPESEHLVNRLDTMPNRGKVYDLLKQQGATVLVGAFDPGEMNETHPGAAGWQRLGATRFYALRLDASR